MKPSIVLLSSLEASRIARQAFQGPDVTRRYFQLTEMMKHHNIDFDERKYWSYGCNCLILGIIRFNLFYLQSSLFRDNPVRNRIRA